MVAEEIGLTQVLREHGREVIETDIGEYIVDIEGRGPSHITAPAIHLNRTRIRALLAQAGADVPDDDPVRLSRAVRDAVGDFFADVDAGITGANAVVASSGRMVIVENEGNVSLGLSRPRLHIAVTGIEKVVADEAAALAVLQVLAPSATAQPLTAFTHFVGAPAPGQERHLVFVDNGRSRILADERYRDVLRCIRCGACMNGCPVYAAAGGLSYGSPYMGPIGAVLSPLLWPEGGFDDLPGASSLCGRCSEVCPVGIPLHRMLLDLRADAAERGKGGVAERAVWKAWREAFAGGRRGRLAARVGRLGIRLGGRLRRANTLDPRGLPQTAPGRDPQMLLPLHPAEPAEAAPSEDLPDDPVELFRVRAAAIGADVTTEAEPHEGDLRVEAAAAVAGTGSVLLTSEQADRGRLLGATRIVVRVDPATIVRHPEDLAPVLAANEANAVILTGASRTADIEKKIVRGIHGAEALVVELGGSEKP